MTSEPRIIKYESDKFILKGDYYGAVWESLKESGVLFNKRLKVKKMNHFFSQNGLIFRKHYYPQQIKKLLANSMMDGWNTLLISIKNTD
jgi:hypothetical protein